MAIKFKIIVLICSVFFAGALVAQKNISICFEVKKAHSKFPESLISVKFDREIFQSINDEMKLVKISKNTEVVMPFQLDSKESKIWIKHEGKEKNITYCFKKSDNSLVGKPQFNFIKRNGTINLNHGNQSLIGYRYKMKLPPIGVNKLYQKSGYIHPVLSPWGDTLTRIQPPDHFHHYGVWGPWTKTKINNTQVDFWNLKEGQGTVLFKEFKSIKSGKLFTGFTAIQEHFNLSNKINPEIAISENLEVKVWKNDNPNQYFIDYKSVFKTPLENGILLEAYRYGGGLGFRFKEQWDKNNCDVLTSEGENRLTADGTKAKWCIISGVSDDGKSTNGVLFMSHPQNRAHPEPMRVWPISANKNRGDMFFEFCPIRHKEWKIKNNIVYELNYRMLVFEGSISPEQAEAHWRAFAYEPLINMK